MQCAKNKPYELLKTGMAGSPNIVLCRYHESGESRIRNYADPQKAVPECQASMLVGTQSVLCQTNHQSGWNSYKNSKVRLLP